jgi:hypothetical protein
VGPSGGNGYSTWGGRNSDQHLRVLVTVADAAGAPLSGVSVTATLSGPASTSTTSTTDLLGQVELKITNAPAGIYNTTVSDVSGSGVRWDGTTTSNSFVKN